MYSDLRFLDLRRRRRETASLVLIAVLAVAAWLPG
jgi:hypothetical protein